MLVPVWKGKRWTEEQGICSVIGSGAGVVATSCEWRGGEERWWFQRGGDWGRAVCSYDEAWAGDPRNQRINRALVRPRHQPNKPTRSSDQNPGSHQPSHRPRSRGVITRGQRRKRLIQNQSNRQKGSRTPKGGASGKSPREKKPLQGRKSENDDAKIGEIDRGQKQ